MKKIIALALVLLLILSGCAAPSITSSGGTSSNLSQNSSLDMLSSSITSSSATSSFDISSSSASSSYSSESITVVNPLPTVGTENTVSGSKVPSDVLPTETDTWCYDRITEEQQRIYKILLSSVNRMAYGWIDLGKCNTETYKDDIAVAYRAFTYDYPELFWVPYEYVVKLDSFGVKLAFSLSDGEFEGSYIVPLASKKEMKKEIDKVVSEIVAEIKGKTSDKMEMLTLLHDKLSNMVTYYDEPIEQDLLYTVYGALIWGYAVCEGYARTMRYLCEQLDIDCIIVTGISKNEQHMWNMVRLDDEWYHIDLTWNDPGLDSEGNPKTPLHPYFNITDEVILKDHVIDPDVTKVAGSGADLSLVGFNFGIPEAKGEKYDYYDYNKLNFSDMAVAAQKIAKIYKTQNYIELRLSDEQLKIFQIEDETKRNEEIGRFFASLILNVHMKSKGDDFTITRYVNNANTLYLQW